LIRNLLRVLPLILPLASCGTIGRVEPVPGNGCDWDRAIYVSPKDSLTDDTAKQIQTHDEDGARICGWKPHKAGK
jgi:hypothetical protein